MTQFGAAVFGAQGVRLTPDEIAFYRDANPFGFILFARNIENPDQVRALCGDFREAVGRNAPIAIDQEGGRVQRLRGPNWREWTPPLDFVKRAGAASGQAMYLRYRLIAHELFDLGIDCNCAPMVDLARPETHDFLRNRCYGSDPRNVADVGHAVAQGLLDGGVLPILKHLPGHGRATLDSHFSLPRVSAALSELEVSDFVPFKSLSNLPMGMTAHLVYEAVDTAPATTSSKMMTLIRDQIGFDSLIMTDDISMKALQGSLKDLSKAALKSGCDAILHCNGSLAEQLEVADAAGPMSEKAQQRAKTALAARKTPDTLDIPFIEAKLETLLDGQVYG